MYFIKQNFYFVTLEFKKKVKIMKNLLKKWIFIAQFHFQDPDSEYGSGSTRIRIPNTSAKHLDNPITRYLLT